MCPSMLTSDGVDYFMKVVGPIADLFTNTTEYSRNLNEAATELLFIKLTSMTIRFCVINSIDRVSVKHVLHLNPGTTIY